MSSKSDPPNPAEDPMGESDPVIEAREEVRAAHEILEVITKEHRRISRDLHDSVGQELTALRYMSVGLAERLRGKGLEEADSAELIARSVQEAQRMLRRAIKGVLPAEVTASGLPKALKALAANVRERYRVECVLKSPEELVLPDEDTAGELLKIAQESCGNAVKHARAKHIAIRLMRDEEGICLEIENDGRPIDLEDEDSATGIGLQIMRSRARVIGAEFRIEPVPGGGARVTVCVPPGEIRPSGTGDGQGDQ